MTKQLGQVPEVGWEVKKARFVRHVFYTAQVVLLVYLYFGNADPFHELDKLEDWAELAVYLVVSLTVDWLLIKIREDPGIVSYEHMLPIMDIDLADELNKGGYTDYKFEPNTKMQQLNEILLGQNMSLPFSRVNLKAPASYELLEIDKVADNISDCRSCETNQHNT